MIQHDARLLGREIGGVYAFLRDGDQVLIRPYRPLDRDAVIAFFDRLSTESRALRFHSAGIHIDASTINYAVRGHALVCELRGQIVALATYVRLRDPLLAEMAIAVDDGEHGRGIGSVLFEHLAHDARRDSIERLVASVLAWNRPMLDLLRGLGFELTRTVHGESYDEMEVEVSLRADPAYVASSDARLHVATMASLEPILRARTVAVVGASRKRGSIGFEVLHNLLASGYEGAVYPVNPMAQSIASIHCYPTVADIPVKIDVAVIVVPARAVLQTVGDSLQAGARGIVVISAGFSEMGDAGRERQQELLHMCRSYGARLIGPNCMGVLVNGATGAMNATFAPNLPPFGPVAISSQSGALGIAILDRARALGLGISSFVSIGNKADVSSNDLIEWWEDDPNTNVIVLYLESFGNPRRFARIARRVGARKAIVAVKGGRSAAGQRAAASHTAALAGSDVAVDALFRQSGVIRCDTLEELFDATALLAHQPLPSGRRVGILTNAGGLGILCADACSANGLQVPPLSPATQAALAALLPPSAATGNPVDMLASGSAESYGQALRLLLNDPEVDSAIVLFIPPLVTEAADVARELVKACSPAPAKPVLACFVGAQGIQDSLRGERVIPSYTFPEAAARALGHAADRADWLRRPVGDIPALVGYDREAARSVLSDVLQHVEPGERAWLTPLQVGQLLQSCGIARPIEVMAHSAAAAAAAAERIGGPVAVKLVSSTILHKSDVGGVQLGIQTPADAAVAYEAIASSVATLGQATEMEGVLVQPMIEGGVECLVGVVTDPTFGPLIAFGLGGINAEVIGDVTFRVHPLTDRDAEELIHGGKAGKLLRGYRGAPPADADSLRDLLLRLSQMVEDVPEIIELDLNPVIVRPVGQGALALDARIRVAHL